MKKYILVLAAIAAVSISVRAESGACITKSPALFGIPAANIGSYIGTQAAAGKQSETAITLYPVGVAPLEYASVKLVDVKEGRLSFITKDGDFIAFTGVYLLKFHFRDPEKK